eukprot:TRINITY_DN9583_c0_g1_i2.p1 TRINITY_DN9583_c0_g1~~TRINITY_DN9583_c0_g1_i2.p1  ORF type:complete len:191 (+),score=31.66 TRINITY_DN9583_c0_g1_i2:32-604(+)
MEKRNRLKMMLLPPVGKPRESEFVLDGTKKLLQVPEYNSLADPLMEKYFYNKKVRRNLYKSRLIDRKGNIISNPEKYLHFEEKKGIRLKSELLETQGKIPKGTKSERHADVFVRYGLPAEKAHSLMSRTLQPRPGSFSTWRVRSIASIQAKGNEEKKSSKSIGEKSPLGIENEWKSKLCLLYTSPSPRDS